MPKKIIRIVLRIPANTHEAVKKIAEIERRSLNSQMVWYIEQGLPEGILDETQADLALAAEAGK